MVWNYQNADWSFKNKFITILGTLSYPATPKVNIYQTEFHSICMDGRAMGVGGIEAVACAFVKNFFCFALFCFAL